VSSEEATVLGLAALQGAYEGGVSVDGSAKFEAACDC
jgi:hypothetical protein